MRRELRVAVVAGPDAGHALPAIAIAGALRDRGHEVLVATGTQWQLDLSADGLPFVEIPLLAPSERDADVGYRLWGRAGDMARPLADLLAHFEPDLVVTDVLTRAGAFAAELLGRPWIETSPHFLYDPDPAVPPIGLGAAPPRTPWARASQASIRRRQAMSVAQGRRAAAGVRDDLGLTGGGEPLGRLLATLPVLEPARTRWPDRTFVVGALAWEPPTWPELSPPEGTGPLVLVSDSTASEVTRTIADVAFTWLRTTDGVRAVVTTSQELAGAPDRVVVGRGRHLSLLPHADVVVGTAGHGLVTKALTAGVPVVLVPLQGDQRETAARVERAGVGLAISPSRLTASRLATAVGRALTDRAMRDRVEAVAADARRLGPARAARAVESLMASRRAA